MRFITMPRGLTQEKIKPGRISYSLVYIGTALSSVQEDFRCLFNPSVNYLLVQLEYRHMNNIEIGMLSFDSSFFLSFYF